MGGVAPLRYVLETRAGSFFCPSSCHFRVEQEAGLAFWMMTMFLHLLLGYSQPTSFGQAHPRAAAFGSQIHP